MSKLPVIKDHEMLALLLRAGFAVVRWGGTSHAQLAHPEKPGVRITIAVHHRDMHPSEIRKTLRQAQITVEEFRKLL
jgi:predicted RNA binding protein YcfA (HicA-like mRNA interferase family)